MKFILSLILASSVVLATGSGWSGGGGGSGTFPDSLGSLWVDTLSADTTIMDNALLLMGLNVGGDAAVVGDLGADSLHAKDICGNRIYGEYQEIDSLVIRGDSTVLDTAYTRSVNTAFETSTLPGIVATTDATFHVLEVDAYCRRGSAFDCFAVMYAAYDTTSGPVGGIIAVSDTVTHPGGNALLTFQFDSVATNGTAVIVLVGTLGESFLLSYESPAFGSAYLIYNSGASWEYDLSKLPYMTIRGYSFVDATRLMTFNGDTGIFTMPRSLSLGGFTITGDLDSSWVHIPYLFADTTKIGYLRGNNSTFSTLTADSIDTRALQADTITGVELSLASLSVSDSAFIDTLQVNVVNGSSPITFRDDIYAPSISSLSGWLSALDVNNSEGYWEFLAGPDSLAWVIQEMDADKTDYTWDSYIAADGTVYVLSWRDSDNNLLFWERPVGTGVWSSTQIDVAATVNVARMAVSNTGNVFVVWNDGSAFLRRRISGVWQGEQAIGTSEYANSMAVDYCNSTNTLGVVYAIRPVSNVFYLIQESTDNGATLGTADTVKANVTHSSGNHYMDIAYNESGVPQVVWQNTSNSIYHSYRTAPSTWAADAQIDGTNGSANPPKLEVYGDSLLIASSNGTYLRLSVNEDGGGWSSAQIKATDISPWAIGGVAVNSSGKVAVVAGDVPYNDLYLVSNTTGSWVSTQLANTETPKWAGIDYNPIVNAWAIYYAKSTLNYSYLLNSSGQGQNTGFSDIVARINSTAADSLTGFMLDPGGYGNVDTIGGTLHIGNAVGENDTLYVHGIVKMTAYTQNIVLRPASAVLGPTAPVVTAVDTYGGLAFDADAETAYLTVEIPDDWDGASNLNLKIYWTSETGDRIALGETVIFKAEWRSISVDNHELTDQGSVATDSVTYTEADNPGPAPENETNESIIAIAYTGGNQPLTAGDVIGIKFWRDKTNDTYSGDAIVLQWEITYTSNGIRNH